MYTTTVSLLERLRTPADRQAWNQFALLYTPLLYSWVLNLGLQHSDAEDVVQEVMRSLLVKLPEFVYAPNKGKFRSWLKVILRHKLVDFQRKRKDQNLKHLPIDRHDDGVEDLGFIDLEHNQALVKRALTIMQTEFQTTTWQACWKVVVEDRPAAEVARELSTTLDVVYAAKSRVLRRLRESLTGLL